MNTPIYGIDILIIRYMSFVFNGLQFLIQPTKQGNRVIFHFKTFTTKDNSY